LSSAKAGTGARKFPDSLALNPGYGLIAGKP
jgi:hypothetical protein